MNNDTLFYIEVITYPCPNPVACLTNGCKQKRPVRLTNDELTNNTQYRALTRELCEASPVSISENFEGVSTGPTTANPQRIRGI